MITPPNVNIQDNINQARNYAKNHTAPEIFWWFYNQVKNKGPWDYKQDKSGNYQEFGNFNYGATGKAMGIPEQILLRMAGLAQTIAETSNSSWSNFVGDSPYGDDPQDQNWIIDGFKYYDGLGFQSVPLVGTPPTPMIFLLMMFMDQYAPHLFVNGLFFQGNAGNDTLIGGTGSDQLYGGAGDDTYQLQTADTGIDSLKDGQGQDQIKVGDEIVQGVFKPQLEGGSDYYSANGRYQLREVEADSKTWRLSVRDDTTGNYKGVADL